MTNLSTQKFIFDFDGVICDSAFEAFRIGATVSKMINHPNNAVMDHVYPQFLRYRSQVGPAWNYYYVFQNLKNNPEGSLAHWKYTKEAISFETEFFNTRKKFKEADFFSWLSLHKPYDDIIRSIKKQRIRPVILTNKNSEPVSQLMDNYDLSYSAILSTTDFPKSMRKIDIINEYLPYAKFFIDDHLETVEICQQNKSSDELIIKYALWGYGHQTKHQLALDKRGFETCLNMISLQ